jgi:hypothetical protein
LQHLGRNAVGDRAWIEDFHDNTMGLPAARMGHFLCPYGLASCAESIVGPVTPVAKMIMGTKDVGVVDA